jgi:hypothetical protein
MLHVTLDDGLRAAIATAQTRAADLNPLAAPLAAADAARDVLAHQPDAHVFALWLADAVLAQRLTWPVAIPLLASGLTPLRVDGRRPPIDTLGCLNGYAAAARHAVGQFTQLGQRAEALLAVVPKLRAAAATAIVDQLLAEDAVLGSDRVLGRSDRAVRRVFERLLALGVVRELSGRATFRLYGL